MTAEHLSRVTGLPVAFDSLLHERNFGDIRGTAYADLGFDPFEPSYAPPNGESWDVFHARVDRAWARVREVAAATQGHLAVVTHGLVCRSLAGRHLALPEGQTVPERWENTSVTIVEGRAPWRVQLLNCATHLDDLPAASAPARRDRRSRGSASRRRGDSARAARPRRRRVRQTVRERSRRGRASVRRRRSIPRSPRRGPVTR